MVILKWFQPPCKDLTNKFGKRGTEISVKDSIYDRIESRVQSWKDKLKGKINALPCLWMSPVEVNDRFAPVNNQENNKKWRPANGKYSNYNSLSFCSFHLSY